MITKKKCASCKSTNINLLLNLGSTALANSFLNNKNEFKKEKKFPLKLYICLNCKLVQVFHSVKPSEFFINYDYLSGASTTWIRHCKSFTKKIIKKFKLNKNNGSVIEIASNDGVLIENFVKKRFQCFGIEPSKIAHNIAKRKGIRSINKFFNSKLIKKLKSKRPQLIIANNVIAHVKNINNFVYTLSKISNEKTIISIEFPYVSNLKKKLQFDTVYHEHHYYYSLGSISKLLNRHNLEIFDLEKISIHGGSLRIFVKTKKSKRNISSKYTSLLNLERDIKLNTLKFYKNYQREVEKIKQKTIKLLNQLKKQKKEVHAYGAAAKGNTFLNFCRIKDNQIKYIYEVNTSKVNKFLPGSHIKILSHKEIRLRKPDYIVILPWNIFDEIKKQLQYTRKWKCKLIRLLPNIQIIN